MLFIHGWFLKLVYSFRRLVVDHTAAERDELAQGFFVS